MQMFKMSEKEKEKEYLATTQSRNEINLKGGWGGIEVNFPKTTEFTLGKLWK